jgi:hypothetical protein
VEGVVTHARARDAEGAEGARPPVSDSIAPSRHRGPGAAPRWSPPVRPGPGLLPRALRVSPLPPLPPHLSLEEAEEVEAVVTPARPRARDGEAEEVHTPTSGVSASCASCGERMRSPGRRRRYRTTRGRLTSSRKRRVASARHRSRGGIAAFDTALSSSTSAAGGAHCSRTSTLQLLEGLRRVAQGQCGAGLCRECGQPFLNLDARRSSFCVDRERFRFSQRERRKRLGAPGSAPAQTEPTRTPTDVTGSYTPHVPKMRRG